MRLTAEEKNRVEQTLNQYYVYALCKNDGTPFYIGKGSGLRVFAHEDSAQLAKDSIDADDTLNKETKEKVLNQQTEKIKTILEEDIDPVKVIIKWGLTEHEALMCESSLINMLEYMGKKNVHCCTLTNIVNGHASKQEKESVADVKTQARDVETFLKECAVPERDINDIKHRVAFIKINKLYLDCFDENGNVVDWRVKECVRGCWPLAERRFKRIDYIFALYRRRVVGIYHVTKRHLVTEQDDFPTFPNDVREMDRWLSKYSSLSDAQQELSPENYNLFLQRLDKKDKTPQEVLIFWRRRVYFSVDEKVSEDLYAYKNTLLTKNNSTDFLKSQWPIQYNFE